jgi:hypothetical protein
LSFIGFYPIASLISCFSAFENHNIYFHHIDMLS